MDIDACGVNMAYDDKTVQFRLIEMDDAENVYRFVTEHFYKNEPLCSSEPFIEATDDDQQDIIDCIKYGLSVMAVKVNPIDGHEQLIGINLAHPKTKNDIQKYIEISEKMPDKKWGQIMKLLAYVNVQANIFERYAVSNVLYSFISCVHPDSRGKSLSKYMKQQLMVMGKAKGFTILTADCSSFYSARVCEQLGMECAFQLAYRDYCNEANKPIFQPSPPHDHIKCFAIRIQ